MARSIVLNFDGEVSEFGITRLRRDKLYGRKKKIVVDETGVQCTMASLTRDGSTLLPSGAVSYLYTPAPPSDASKRRPRWSLMNEAG